MIKQRVSPSASGGSVLILVLWVLFFLAALTVAVGTHVSSAMTAAQRLWERTAARCQAEAGAHRALRAAMSQTNAWDGVGESAWNRDPEGFEAFPVGGGFCSVYYETPDEDGGGVTNIGMIGEAAKLNVNKVTDKTMRKALVYLVSSAGELDAAQANAIVSVIEDWVDEDSEMLTEGAESDYYSGLSPSYACADAPMRSMAELRLVKGMTDTLYARLAPYLTVYGAGFVNLNAASERVLVALAQASVSTQYDLETCESLAAKIVRFQESGHAFQEKDAKAIRKTLKEFEALSSEEDSVFLKMMGSISVGSIAFRGVAARVDEAGTPTGGAVVAFVCDTTEEAFVHWRERE